MSEQLVPETDEQVKERLLEMFGDITAPGFGGTLFGLYQVNRLQGDGVRRAWVKVMASGGGVPVPDLYLEEERESDQPTRKA